MPAKLSPKALKGLVDAGAYLDAHLKALGGMCWAFANLDNAISRLYEPVLQCSEEQAACIMIDNLSTRRDQLNRLLHLEVDLPDEFVSWVGRLLSRACDELASERNRCIHDCWTFNWSVERQSVARISKKPRLSKVPSRPRKQIIVRSENPTTAEDLQQLEGRIHTVASALGAARRSLETWRRTNQFSAPDPEWLPAGEARARGMTKPWSAEAHPVQPPPSRYVFD